MQGFTLVLPHATDKPGRFPESRGFTRFLECEEHFFVEGLDKVIQIVIIERVPKGNSL